MKKILILGGSHRDIPLINAAKELGFYVITLGAGKLYIGHNFADMAYKIDFNDLSAVRKIIRDQQVNYILPGCGEECYLNALALVEEFGVGNLDCLKSAKTLHNKWNFKEFCLNNNISTPNGFFFSNKLDLTKIQLPVVVKPTCLSGGRGIEVVTNRKDLERALHRAEGISKEVFLEEFIDGELFAYSVFIKNKKVIYGFTGKDDTYLNKYLIATAYPIHFSDKIVNILNADIEKISRKLCLVDGMFHLQVLVRENTPYIIDVTRRIPGDLYPYLIEYCNHVKYSQAVVRAYLGENVCDEFVASGEKNFVVRHVVMPDRNGVFDGIYIDPTLYENIIFRLDLCKIDFKVTNYLNTQLSIFFLELSTDQQHLVGSINDLIVPLVSI